MAYKIKEMTFEEKLNEQKKKDADAKMMEQQAAGAFEIW